MALGAVASGDAMTASIPRCSRRRCDECRGTGVRLVAGVAVWCSGVPEEALRIVGERDGAPTWGPAASFSTR